LGRPADYAEPLAQHYAAAIELDKAAGRPTDDYASAARTALRDAGDHALGLNAFGTAVRYYRAALDLVPPDDAERPLLLFKYGKALQISAETGDDVLAEAEIGLRQQVTSLRQPRRPWFAVSWPGTAATGRRPKRT
jgi:hypothetical protein